MIRALDLFCGAGGASMGLHRAGFDVTGVDIKPQKNYPFKFIEADAMTFPLDGGWDFIWASPPCQKYSQMQPIRRRSHPDLIGPVRGRIKAKEIAFVIENVPGAPLISPAMLCGQMFGLQMYRHRIFESSFPVNAPNHLPHVRKCERAGRRPINGNYLSIAGHFPCVDLARKAMGINWMTRDELAQAIPPAYSEYIARQFVQHKQNNLQPIEARQ